MTYRGLRRRMMATAPLLAVRIAWERIRHGHHA